MGNNKNNKAKRVKKGTSRARRHQQMTWLERWGDISIANRCLIIIGAIAAIATAFYAATYVYSIYLTEQRANEAVIGVKINTDEVSGERLRFSFEVSNKGARKLANLKYCILADQKRVSHSFSDCQPDGITSQGPFAVLPNDKWTLKALVEDARIPAVRSRQLYLYVVGVVSYQQGAEQKTIPMCGVYNEDFREIGDCMSVTNQNPN